MTDPTAIYALPGPDLDESADIETAVLPLRNRLEVVLGEVEDRATAAIDAAAAAAAADRDDAFGSYRTLAVRGMYSQAYAGVGVNVLAIDPLTALDHVTATDIIYIDPADFQGDRDVKLRLDVSVITGGTAPGAAVNWTFTLRTAVVVAGAAGSHAIIDPTDVVPGPGSALILGGVPAGTFAHVAGVDFDCPAAGPYVLCHQQSAAMAANSKAALQAKLSVRQVAP